MTRTYNPPGPGTWEQDSTHCPRPLTPYIFEVFRKSFVRGFSEGTARYGLLFSHLEPALVNGFMYYRQAMVDPSDQEEIGRRFGAAENAFRSRLWLRDLEDWDRNYKPDSIRRNRELQAVPIEALETGDLATHLTRTFENANEMVYRHHIFTIPSIVPIGVYLANAAEWTGLGSEILLEPLRGASPVSLGAQKELREVGAALGETGVHPEQSDDTPARDILESLRTRSDSLGSAVRKYLDAIGLRLAGGYDIADPCAIELPELLLKAIWSTRDAGGTSAVSGGEELTRVRDAVPDPHRERFDEIFDDARRMSRLRDERGIYNDIWGTGVARRAVMETGRRLAEAGRIDDPENALDANHAEQVAMLTGEGGPSRDELGERTQWRRTARLNEVPPFLGPAPSPPPPLEGLPPFAAEALRAMGTALGELFTPPGEGSGEAIRGKPVSPGAYTGTARVVTHPGEFGKITKGDVLVTSSTSAAFNVVLPLLGALVTDRGGLLSHAAIVAREYGIPAVVGTLKATLTIPDGAPVRVDGTAGRVELL